MTRTDIMNMDRHTLQNACKDAGISAKGKTVDLQAALIATLPVDETPKAKKTMPKEFWAIYRAISRKHPEMSKKAVATRARYAYNKRYAQAPAQAE